jgi:integrase
VAVVAFHFALETAMRSGEILGLTWASVKPNFVILEMTKNGERREVPLSPRAKELLAYMRTFDRPFPIAKGTRDALFRRLVADAGLTDLHFHDSRAEAIYRLSKKLDVLSLASMVGHRDLKSLQLYYRTTSDELALRL